MSLAYRRLLRKTVIANTKTGKTFRGVLMAQRGPLLILVNASIYEQGGILPVDGEIVLERSNVDFLQVIDAASV